MQLESVASGVGLVFAHVVKGCPQGGGGGRVVGRGGEGGLLLLALVI